MTVQKSTVLTPIIDREIELMLLLHYAVWSLVEKADLPKAPARCCSCPPLHKRVASCVGRSAKSLH
jgi:hypothetical protein